MKSDEPFYQLVKGFFFVPMQKINQFIFRHSLILQWLWALVIFILCATPGDYIPSSNWLELLSVDKLVHAGIFFTLTTLGIITVFRKKGFLHGRLWLVTLICVLYGASLEVMQATVFRNRSADWFDMVANAVGCLSALLLARKFLRRFSPFQQIT